MRFHLMAAAVLTAAVLALSPSAAHAKEYCAARLAQTHHFTGENATVHSFVLEADAQRTVSATLIAQTQKGWYRMQIAQAVLTPYDQKFATPLMRFSVQRFTSPVQYVRFPGDATEIAYWYVASTTGAQGTTHDCPPPALDGISPRAGRGLNAISRPPYDLLGEPMAAAVQTASPMDAPRVSCTTPFREATVAQLARPEDPSFAGQFEVFVIISIDDTGKLDDARVWGSSGVDTADNEALRSARLSKYSPGMAFCKPVPGNYLYHVVLGF